MLDTPLHQQRFPPPPSSPLHPPTQSTGVSELTVADTVSCREILTKARNDGQLNEILFGIGHQYIVGVATGTRLFVINGCVGQ